MIVALRAPARPAATLRLLGLVALLLVLESGLGVAVQDPRWLLLYLAALAALALAGITLLRPAWGALALVFLLFTRLSDVYGPHGGVLTVNQVLVASFLAAMLLQRLVAERRGLSWDRLLGWMLCFAGAIALSALEARDRGATLAELGAHLREAVILFLLLNLITTLPDFRRLAWAIVAAGTFLALGALLYAATGVDLGGLAKATTNHLAGADFGRRLTGPVGDANDFARLLVTVVPLALYRFLAEQRPWPRLAALAALATIGPTIVLTYSRGGILALLAVLALAAIRRGARPQYLLVVALVLAATLLAAPRPYWERLEATIAYFSGERSALALRDSSLQERGWLLQIGLSIVLAHPLLGVGKENYNLVYPEYAWRVSPSLAARPMEAHSTPVQIAAETGLVGLVAFLAIVVVAVLNAREARSRCLAAGLRREALLGEAVELALYGYLVASLFLSDSYPRYLWLLVGLAMVARQTARTLPVWLRARPAALARSAVG